MSGDAALATTVVLAGILLVGGCMAGYPQYQVYQQRLEEEAENDAYLRYLWIQNLENGGNQVIYVPTEAGLPILEADKR